MTSINGITNSFQALSLSSSRPSTKALPKKEGSEFSIELFSVSNGLMLWDRKCVTHKTPRADMEPLVDFSSCVFRHEPKQRLRAGQEELTGTFMNPTQNFTCKGLVEEQATTIISLVESYFKHERLKDDRAWFGWKSFKEYDDVTDLWTVRIGNGYLGEGVTSSVSSSSSSVPRVSPAPSVSSTASVGSSSASTASVSSSSSSTSSTKTYMGITGKVVSVGNITGARPGETIQTSRMDIMYGELVKKLKSSLKDQKKLTDKLQTIDKLVEGLWNDACKEEDTKALDWSTVFKSEKRVLLLRGAQLVLEPMKRTKSEIEGLVYASGLGCEELQELYDLNREEYADYNDTKYDQTEYYRTILETTYGNLDYDEEEEEEQLQNAALAKSCTDALVAILSRRQ